MKLYYDTTEDKIVEAGTFGEKEVSRDVHGNIRVCKNLDYLYLIGEIYEQPIVLKKNLELLKVNGNESYSIIQGFTRNDKISGGSRFFIHSKGFNYYSTNIVVGFERINDERIDFYTLSGSHYSIIEVS